MTTEATKANTDEDSPEDSKASDIGSKVKPEFPAEMAQWFVTKLDCPVQLDSHSDRNNFAACINKLIAIANWKDPE